MESHVFGICLFHIRAGQTRQVWQFTHGFKLLRKGDDEARRAHMRGTKPVYQLALQRFPSWNVLESGLMDLLSAHALRAVGTFLPLLSCMEIVALAFPASTTNNIVVSYS